ncbi:hypothetical protein D3C76_1430140 [compost metagenome]
MIGDIVGGARVGADYLHGQHFQLLHRAPFADADARYVATGAVLCEQRATFGGQRLVHRAQPFFRPGRRLESLQGLFDQVQIPHPDAGRVSIVVLEGLPFGIEKAQRSAYSQGFTDIARHGLLRRAIPLHPVESPHVP